MITAQTPISHLLSTPYVNHHVSAHGGQWIVSAFSDGAIAVDEVADGVRRGDCFRPTFYQSRAKTIEDLIQVTVDNSENASVVIQDVAIALLKGRRLSVQKDDELPIAVDVGPCELPNGGSGFVCVQHPNNNQLPAHHEVDMAVAGKFDWHHRTKTEEDFSAFGAAWKFVQIVGLVRAREALRKEAPSCSLA